MWAWFQIDWRRFFEDAMHVVNKKVTPKEEVVVYAPEYLKNLVLLVKEYENTTEGKMYVVEADKNVSCVSRRL